MYYSCSDCLPDKQCGICEMKEIDARTQWWQKQKKQLEERIKNEPRKIERGNST